MGKPRKNAGSTSRISKMSENAQIPGDKEDFQMETQITLNDVMGLEETKTELEEIVHYLRDREQCTRLGGKLHKGILLVGQPGTGKRMLSRAIAGEAGVPLFTYGCRSLIAIDDPKRVGRLFKAAKKRSPCIIYIDNIHNAAECNLNLLLVELDGFKQNNGIILIGATSFPERVDKALLRPGRLHRHIVVPKPDLEGRIKILESYMSKVRSAADVNLTIIARRAQGCSGADLAWLVIHADIKARKVGAREVSMADLKYAMDHIIRSTKARNFLWANMKKNQNRDRMVYDRDSSIMLPRYITQKQSLPV